MGVSQRDTELGSLSFLPLDFVHFLNTHLSNTRYLPMKKIMVNIGVIINEEYFNFSINNHIKKV